jgi:hypothetical protein
MLLDIHVIKAQLTKSAKAFPARSARTMLRR